MPWKSPFITPWAGFRSRNRPTVFAEQGKFKIKTNRQFSDTLLGDMGLYFSFRVLQNLLDPELSAFNFKFPKYSAWAAHGPIKIDIMDKTARLERSGLRAYCETRPIQDTFYENIITDQPSQIRDMLLHEVGH